MQLYLKTDRLGFFFHGCFQQTLFFCSKVFLSKNPVMFQLLFTFWIRNTCMFDESHNNLFIILELFSPDSLYLDASLLCLSASLSPSSLELYHLLFWVFIMGSAYGNTYLSCLWLILFISHHNCNLSTVAAVWVMVYAGMGRISDTFIYFQIENTNFYFIAMKRNQLKRSSNILSKYWQSGLFVLHLGTLLWWQY